MNASSNWASVLKSQPSIFRRVLGIARMTEAKADLVKFWGSGDLPTPLQVCVRTDVVSEAILGNSIYDPIRSSQRWRGEIGGNAPLATQTTEFKNFVKAWSEDLQHDVEQESSKTCGFAQSPFERLRSMHDFTFS